MNCFFGKIFLHLLACNLNFSLPFPDFAGHHKHWYTVFSLHPLNRHFHIFKTSSRFFRLHFWKFGIFLQFPNKNCRHIYLLLPKMISILWRMFKNFKKLVVSPLNYVHIKWRLYFKKHVATCYVRRVGPCLFWKSKQESDSNCIVISC